VDRGFSLRFVGIRLLLALLSLLGVSLLAFAILRLLPGDPALLMAPVGSTSEDLARIRAEFGLTGSWAAQYGAFLGDLVRGRFGKSLWLQQDALRVITERLPATLELAVAAVGLSVVGGIGLALVSVWRRRSWLEHLSVGLGTLGIAVPSFIWGLLLIVGFGAFLGALPVSGRIAPELEGSPVTGSALLDTVLAGDPAALRSVLTHLVLPAVALALPLMAAVFRTTRSDLLSALGEEYVVTERMKGLPEYRLLLWRALKNALIPTVTLVGVQFGFVIGGTVLVETIFGWPGIGQLTLQAFQFRDFPLIQGIVMVYAVAVVLTSLAVDCVYAFLNPRIRVPA
jgi:ABC-type dipeptide/oligopeptide/nickel transport system permease component